MKAFTVSSADLAPSRDNPAGRWDVQFHGMRLTAMRFANAIAANSLQFDRQEFIDCTRGRRQKLILESALRLADSREAIYEILAKSMQLMAPSPELRRGLEEIARRLAHENALTITREAYAMLLRAKKLKS